MENYFTGTRVSLRGELLWNGVYYDNLIMGILRHEFKPSGEGS
jgi:hypothetical protein